mmetsp:Transcript_16545/g.39729  ORF Transcript_16545/g.39729 Transcript_16545/m.39729 type:complete len:239 (+) Transcript_16545:1722-2438(+)
MWSMTRSLLTGFVTHPQFFWFEQDVAILPQTIQTMLIAVAAVLVVTFVFLSHPLTVLFVFVMIVMIDVNLLQIGYMTWWDVPLDSISMINLVLSIGFSVDYSAHLAHAFMLAPGTRDERMQQALSTMGVSIANGGMSTLLATLPLAGSPSYIFFTYFRMMLMAVLFGMMHGLICLPVLLSLIGPPAISRAEAKQTNHTNHVSGRRTASTESAQSDGTDKQPTESQQTVAADLAGHTEV